MQKLNNLFTKDVARPIEGVIKADDAASLRSEVEEYVLTKEVEKRLDAFISAYNDYSCATQNGVWISGFFGSGKSHLLKMLALLLENREIDGIPVADLFLPKCEDAELKAQLQKACSLPSRSILFNIDQKSDAINTRQTDALISVFVKVFDEMCGYYGKQGYIAKFERDLESRGLYEKFQSTYQGFAGKTWAKGREQAILEGRNIAKAYAAITGEPEAIGNGIIDKYRKDYKLSIEDFADQVKEYIDRQPTGFRLNFFVDEVGQYIADNVKLMTNLQTVAETLATKCQGQAWVIVTAQEDMTSVFGEIGKKQGNDFSKIQARFANRLKLTSANVDEVIKKRLLAKKDSSVPELQKLFDEQRNNFKTLFGFTDGSQTYRQFADLSDFVSCYPFVPYQFPLFQTAIQCLSEHNVFEGKHNSVGERSMLGVFQKVIIDLREQNLGTLASFDLMYEGIRQAVKSNAVRAISMAEQHLGNPFAVQVLKALFLVKYVRPFKATARNLAILLRTNFSENTQERARQVQEALNKLESESYIQRNGDLYEYLTDEEQDIEKEIKNTAIDTTDVVDELNKIIFEQILGGTKVRYIGNGQDYTLGKKLDGRNIGRECELRIHIITPWYERTNGEDFHTATWGEAELLVVMPPDSRLMTDVTMFLKTGKYCTKNINTQNERVHRILENKLLGNHDREQEIKVHAGTLLLDAELLINGRTLDCSSGDAKQRILSACQELIQFFYSNLKMIDGTEYHERNIAAYFAPHERELFPEVLSEAELEILNAIRSNRNNGLRTTIKGLLDKFTTRPYGWYNDAILCITAQLAVRGKLELRSDGNLLDGEKLIAALKNSHAYDNVTLEPQTDYTPAQLKKVKDFYNNYFQEPPNSADPKQLGMDLLEKLKKLLGVLSSYDSCRTHYPFLGELSTPLAKLKAVAAKPAGWFFSECQIREMDTLCDDKEDVIDPIIAFMNGTGRQILDHARQLLREQQSNLAYIPHEEIQEVEDIVNDPRCFKGGRMPRLKELTELLTRRLDDVCKQEISNAVRRIEDLIRDFESREDYKQLSQVDQAGLRQPFITVADAIKIQRSIDVIQNKLRNFEETIYKQQLERLYTLAHPVKTNGEKNTPPPVVESVAFPRIHVNFRKPWLENEADIETYIASYRTELSKLEADLREQVKNGKRIKL